MTDSQADGHADEPLMVHVTQEEVERKRLPRRAYAVNEIFYSLQGEGSRAGEPSVFVRFTSCNLTCNVEADGFDCDTEFRSGRGMTRHEILAEMVELWPAAHRAAPRWAVLTGGEPGLQVDYALLADMSDAGWSIQVETNGSIDWTDGVGALGRASLVDLLTVSPKVAEHAVRQAFAGELKYVRAKGQGIPMPRCSAPLKYVSPAWDPSRGFSESLPWCIELVKQHPGWRLSVQQHKLWGVR